MQWNNLSIANKRSVILNLAAVRISLIEKSKERRFTKRKRKKLVPKKMSFKSKELEELFYSMPVEMQKLISK